MKLLLALNVLLCVSLVSAAPTWTGRLRVLLADDLKAYHQEMRRVHRNYVPAYPDLTILTVLKVGTPVVEYWVSLESGSEAIFLLAKDYAGRLPNHSFYDPAQSSSSQFVGDFHAFSGELEVFGSAYDETIDLFGWGSEYSVKQRFGVVNEVYDPFVLNPQMPDGVIGTSWDPADAANPNENSSAMINLFAAIGGPRYWIEWMEIEDVVERDGRRERGYFVWRSFGTSEDTGCAPMTPDTLLLVWFEETRSLAFRVDSFAYKGGQFRGGYAKVDTGVPNILLPYDLFLELYNDVQPAFLFEYGVYVVDCSVAGGLPDWTFTIGGNSYAIPSTAYVVDLFLPDRQCVWSAFQSDAQTTDFVLGYIFHNLWCIKMDIDHQTIGFSTPFPMTPANKLTIEGVIHLRQ